MVPGRYATNGPRVCSFAPCAASGRTAARPRSRRRAASLHQLSTPGSRTPAGAQFAAHIRDRLETAALVVQLITPAYLDSHPCLCELGAAWLRDASMFPLVVPPVTMGQLGFVLGDREARWISRGADLNDLYDRVREQLGLGTTTIRRGDFPGGDLPYADQEGTRRCGSRVPRAGRHWSDEEVAAGNVRYASAVVAPIGRFLADPALTRLLSGREPTADTAAIQPELVGFLWWTGGPPMRSTKPPTFSCSSGVRGPQRHRNELTRLLCCCSTHLPSTTSPRATCGWSSTSHRAGEGDPAGSVRLTLSSLSVDRALEDTLPPQSRDLLRYLREAGRASTGEFVEAVGWCRLVEGRI